MKKLIIILALPLTSLGQTKDSVYKYLVQIGVKHPKIVLKQAILETGHFKSYSCRVRKNLFGITIKGKLITCDSWQESCRKYISTVQYKYKGGDYHNFLFELPYATDPDYIKKLNNITI